MNLSYQAQVEKNIAILQQELPTLFERDLTYDIYTDDIYFNDPVNTFKNKFNYRIIFWTLRFHSSLFFSEIYFDVHNIKQTAVDVISVDWTVRGTLRVPWQAKVYFDGNSTYKMNRSGLIFHHLDSWDRTPGEIVKQFFRPGK